MGTVAPTLATLEGTQGQLARSGARPVPCWVPVQNVTIRRATDSDRSEIETMAREVVAAGEMFVFEEVGEVLDYWQDPQGLVFVATVDSEVAGTYVIKPNQSGRGAHVANAGYMVSESRRGLGLGRAMGEHSIVTARDLGFQALQFNMVVATNHSAVALWKHLGFRVVGTVPEVFRHPSEGLVDAHVMHLTL